MLSLSLLPLRKGCHLALMGPPLPMGTAAGSWLHVEAGEDWRDTSGLVHTPVHPSLAILAAANPDASRPPGVEWWCRACEAPPPTGSLAPAPGPAWKRRARKGTGAQQPSRQPLLGIPSQQTAPQAPPPDPWAARAPHCVLLLPPRRRTRASPNSIHPEARQNHRLWAAGGDRKAVLGGTTAAVPGGRARAARLHVVASLWPPLGTHSSTPPRQ